MDPLVVVWLLTIVLWVNIAPSSWNKFRFNSLLPCFVFYICTTPGIGTNSAKLLSKQTVPLVGLHMHLNIWLSFSLNQSHCLEGQSSRQYCTIYSLMRWHLSCIRDYCRTSYLNCSWMVGRKALNWLRADQQFMVSELLCTRLCCVQIVPRLVCCKKEGSCSILQLVDVVMTGPGSPFSHWLVRKGSSF